MENCVFVYEDLSMKFVKNVKCHQEGFTRVDIKDFSDLIVSIKYKTFWSCKKFKSFMISDKLVKLRGKSAKEIGLDLLFWIEDRFVIEYDVISDLMRIFRENAEK